MAEQKQSINIEAHERFLWRAGTDDEVQVHLAWNPRRRSRCAFLVAPDGSLHVEAPAGMGLETVRRVLADHAGWIRRQRRAGATNIGSWFPAEYVDGASLLFRGEVLTLRLSAEARVHVRGQELVAPSTHPKQEVWAWYAAQGETLLRAALASAVASLPWLADTPRWRHRFMKSRWGSCSGSGRISLNTHLVKLSDVLVEYVVVHELCHLRHMHHGPAFYRLMEASLPDWEQRRSELHRHGGLLLEPAP